MTSYSVIAMVQNVVSLVPRIPILEPRPTHMMFMGEKLALRQVFAAYCNFLTALSFHRYSILTHLSITDAT